MNARTALILGAGIWRPRRRSRAASSGMAGPVGKCWSFGNARLSRDTCPSWRHVLRRFSTRSAQKRPGRVRTFSSVSVEDEKIPANPAFRMGRYLRRGDEPKTEIQPLTRAEAVQLIAAAEKHFPRWHPWILLSPGRVSGSGNSWRSSGVTSTGTGVSWWCSETSCGGC